MTARYVIRPDRDGHTICDLWSGQPATLAGTPQTGLSLADAQHSADLLNATPTQAGAALERGVRLHR